MLDWLKRKGAPAASEQSLESEGQKPLTDERLERLLGRLGPDGRTPSAPVEARSKTDPSPGAPRIATSESPALNDIEKALDVIYPMLSTDTETAEAFAAEAPSKIEP